MSVQSHRLIIVVTGANSGVGFGICHRLLVQLSRLSPSDALPGYTYKGPPLPSPFTPAKHLTLVLACRSTERANAARELLFNFMDAEVSRQRKSAVYDGHAEEFRNNLRIDHLSLDLASMDNIFEFAEEATRKYPYITHLVLNAGVLNITGLDRMTAFKQFVTEPVAAVTTPQFLIQPVGTESLDGLGLVWQSNVFGHYSLSRLMEPLLLLNPYRDSRIEWLTSLDTLPGGYNPTDPQLRQAKFSYQASKYQVDLLCTALAQIPTRRKHQEDGAEIRHILVHPGICHTNMSASVVNYFSILAKLLCFYLVRFFGSPNHPIQPYKGAIAAVHGGLAHATLLQNDSPNNPKKFGSRSTAFGREYVGIDTVVDWRYNAKHAAALVEFCERLFSVFVQRRGEGTSPSTVDSGIGGIS